MSVNLPYPVVVLLGAAGVFWPDVNEDAVREFASAVQDYAVEVASAHDASTAVVSQVGTVYQGAGYDALVRTWTAHSEGHVQALVSGCSAVGTALETGADVVEGLKIAAVIELCILAVSTAEAAAAAVATGGTSLALVPLIEAAARKLVKEIEVEALTWIAVELVVKALEPFEDELVAAADALAFGTLAGGAGLDVAGTGSDAVGLDAEGVAGHVRSLKANAAALVQAGERFSAVAAGVSF